MKYEMTKTKNPNEYPDELINALLHPSEEDDYYSLCERFDYKDVIDAMTALLNNEDPSVEEEVCRYAWDYYLKMLLNEFAEHFKNPVIDNSVE